MNSTRQPPETATSLEPRRSAESHPENVTPMSQKNSPGLAWPRVGLVSFWVLAFALIATGVASSWERIVDRLASGPRLEAGR